MRLALLALLAVLSFNADARNWNYQQGATASPADYCNSSFALFLQTTITTSTNLGVQVDVQTINRQPTGVNSASYQYQIKRDGNVIFDSSEPYGASPAVEPIDASAGQPVFRVTFIDFPTAAAHTYQLLGRSPTGRCINLDHYLLKVEELN